MEDVIIGLEIHVQLNKLNSKMFCGCSTAYHDSEPNTHTCPICLGLPGSLPVLNKKAVEYGIKVGLALNCTIEEETLFYRKNYYYPDLPKGFQISQYDFPLATKGHIMILGDDGAERNIRINRAHMEEDPGRLVHAGTIDKAKYTMVDYNRCGMPLLEVVTEPDLCSPKEARVFLDKLKSILEYLDVFDGSKEGSMRVDANISLKGGDRTEVKNISGFKGVEKALSYEITRQKNMQRRNIKVVQETRHFDEIRNITVSIRSKVGAHDYRYFPECDLVTMRIASWVPAIREALPELPDSKRERFVKEYGLADDHAKSLTSEIRVANFYEAVAAKASPKLAAVWIADVLKGELNYRDLGIESFYPVQMIEIVNMLAEGKITEDGAVEIIRTILNNSPLANAQKTSKKEYNMGVRIKKDQEKSYNLDVVIIRPEQIVEAKGLGRAEDNVVQKAVREAVAENAAAVADYRAGSERALNFIVGQVMKKTRGKASPGEVHTLVKAEVDKVRRFDHNSWQNGANWYKTARALKKASDKVREAYLTAYHNLNTGKQVQAVPGGVEISIDTAKLNIDDLDQYPIAMLLMGYAMENIFRGIIICRMWLDDPESVNVADFSKLQIPVKGSLDKMGIISHHLRGLLAAKAMKLDFTEEEKNMMDTLDMFIVWAGRYATPKEYDPRDPHGLKRLEPIEYPYQTLDSLYLKAIEELKDLCKLQGDRLSRQVF